MMDQIQGIFWAAKILLIITTRLYTTDYILGRTQVFDLDGNLLSIWTASGKEPGKFLWAQKIEVSNNEKIFVADTRNKRVQVFNKKGQLEMIIGGEGKPYFQEPNTIAVDEEGNIFVGDREAEMIYKFDKKRNLKTFWQKYSNQYYLGKVSDIAIDKDGYVYGMSIGKDYIIKWTTNGEYVKRITFNLSCTHFSFDVDNQKNIINTL